MPTCRNMPWAQFCCEANGKDGFPSCGAADTARNQLVTAACPLGQGLYKYLDRPCACVGAWVRVRLINDNGIFNYCRFILPDAKSDALNCLTDYHLFLSGLLWCCSRLPWNIRRKKNASGYSIEDYRPLHSCRARGVACAVTAGKDGICSPLQISIITTFPWYWLEKHRISCKRNGFCSVCTLGL